MTPIEPASASSKHCQVSFLFHIACVHMSENCKHAGYCKFLCHFLEVMLFSQLFSSCVINLWQPKNAYTRTVVMASSGNQKCQIWGLPTNFWLQENLMKVNYPRLLFQSSCYLCSSHEDQDLKMCLECPFNSRIDHCRMVQQRFSPSKYTVKMTEDWLIGVPSDVEHINGYPREEISCLRWQNTVGRLQFNLFIHDLIPLSYPFKTGPYLHHSLTHCKKT